MEIEVWHSEYELRQFIDIATRYNIAACYKLRSQGLPYSFFTEHIKGARLNFELFSRQLLRRLSESQNVKAIEVDLNSRFLIGINMYRKWYNDHRQETEIWGTYNPYSIMMGYMESTEEEIKKYFPEDAGNSPCSEENKLPDLPNDDRAEYFKLLFSNAYPALEQRLYNAGYIDNNRQWQGTANVLVNYLMVLEDHKKFRRDISAKKKKDFIETRYQKNITQANKPSKRKISEFDRTLFNNFINNQD